MTELVDPTEIELIVGAPRHPDQHIGRAVSDEETVYILHSQRCKDSTEDLRLCPYSKALDQGIDVEDWAGYVDRPVFLVILSRGLFPVPIERQDPVLEYLDRLKEMSPSPSLSRQIAELESARRALRLIKDAVHALDAIEDAERINRARRTVEDEQRLAKSWDDGYTAGRADEVRERAEEVRRG